MAQKKSHIRRHADPPPPVWDAAIVVLLLACALAGIWADAHLGSHPSVWLEALRLIAGVGFALVAYGSFIEPRMIRVRRERVPLPAAKKLRIAVISDLHVGPYNGARFVQRIVAKVNALEPDLIVLPGDFIENGKSLLSDLAPLKFLRAPLGAYAVLGNHDTGHYITLTGVHYRHDDRTDAVEKALTDVGVRVLRNERVLEDYQGRKIAVAGADHVWMKSADLKKALKDIPPAALTILLAHIPDVILDEDSRMADLIICGHTHGGQMRLPGIGPLTPIPDKLGRAYAWGLRKLENGSYVDISCGIGESGVRARLFCPPEIVVLEVGEH